MNDAHSTEAPVDDDERGHGQLPAATSGNGQGPLCKPITLDCPNLVGLLWLLLDKEAVELEHHHRIIER